MAGVESRIAMLVGRLTDLATSVAGLARRASIVSAVAALVVVIVLRVEPGLGFGWSPPGWWIPATATAAPSVVLWMFSMSAGSLARVVRDWPAKLGDAAEASVDAAAEVVGSAQVAVARRRGVAGLVGAVWRMRRVVGEVRELLGGAAPALAVFSPLYLLVTLVAIVAGTMLTIAAAGLLLLRIVL